MKIPLRVQFQRPVPTRYFYDGNGNTIEVAKPSVANSEGGSFHPTELYSYDTNNNVTAYCDAHSTHALGLDYTGSAPSPSDSLCPNSPAGATTLTYTYPTYEPYGELATIATALGYHHTFAYAALQQVVASNGNTTNNTTDFGLPTSITGDVIARQIDGTSRAPLQVFSYDASGNVKNHGTGYGNGYGVAGGQGAGSTFYMYDAMAHATSEQDAIGVVSSRTFYGDGSIQTTQSPSQLVAGVSSAYTYDADANEISETHYHGCVAGYTSYCVYNAGQGAQTTKWYDGADRLVEVQQPHDSFSDYYPYPWETRYWYDLSQHGALTIGGDSGLYANGNLYETEEYLPSLTWDPSGPPYSPPTSGSWVPVKGTTYDGVDREIAKYDLGMYIHAQTTNAYDCTGLLGYLCTTTNALGGTPTWGYDYIGRMTSVSFSDSTPGRQYTYDSDGRVTSINSNSYGAMTKSYDADGRLSQVVEPNAGGLTKASTLTYGFYADGLRSTLSVSGGETWSSLFADSYRADGLLQTDAVNWTGVSSPYTMTYDVAGRKTASTNPLTNVTGGSESIVYDQWGRVTSWTGSTPGANRTGITYDYEGSPVYETTSFNGQGQCNPQCTVTYAYDVRGEVFATQYNLGSPVYTGQTTNKYLPQSASFSANGYMVGTWFPYQGYTNTGPANFNTADDMPYHTGTTGNGNAYAYDSLGRETTTNQTQVGSPPPGCSGSLTRTYDIENHTTGLNFSGFDFTFPACSAGAGGSSGSTTYGWGPNGHPVLATSQVNPNATTSDTLHWDGDSLLFVTDQHGNVLQVKAGPNSDDLLPTGGIWVYDRDLSGVVSGTHTSTQSLGFTAGDDPYQQTNGGVPLWVQQQGSILEPRSDGIWDGYNVFQGVRSSDPQTGTWTTPDEFPGSVHDPMSQKSYMWNGNNPVQYSDPSGYCLEDLCIGEAALAAFIINAEAPEIEEELAPAVSRLSQILEAFGPRVIQFGQRAISQTFGAGKTNPFRSMRLGAVIKALRSGKISPDELPIQVIRRGAVTYTLNNRSLMVLRLAGKTPTKIQDVTGNAADEAELTRRLGQIQNEQNDGAPYVPNLRPL